MNNIFFNFLLVLAAFFTLLLSGCDALPEFKELEKDSNIVDSQGVTKVSVNINYPKTRGMATIVVNQGWLVILKCVQTSSYDNYLGCDYYQRNFYIEKLIKVNFSGNGQPTNLKNLPVTNGSKIFLLAVNYCPVDLNNFNADGTPKSSTLKIPTMSFNIDDITQPSQIYSGAYYYHNLSGGSVNLTMKMNLFYEQLNIKYKDPVTVQKRSYEIWSTSYESKKHPIITLDSEDGSKKQIREMQLSQDTLHYKVEYKVDITVCNTITPNTYRIAGSNINEDWEQNDPYNWSNGDIGVIPSGAGQKSISLEFKPFTGDKTYTYYPANSDSFKCKHYAKFYVRYKLVKQTGTQLYAYTRSLVVDPNSFYPVPLPSDFSASKSSNKWTYFNDIAGMSFDNQFGTGVATYKLISDEQIQLNNNMSSWCLKNINFFVNNDIPSPIWGNSNINTRIRKIDLNKK